MKGAVASLTLYITKESDPSGIAVKVVAAGAIATDFVGGSLRDDPRINRLIATQTALDRASSHADIGDVIASLLIAGTAKVNAQRIEASGGMVL